MEIDADVSAVKVGVKSGIVLLFDLENWATHCTVAEWRHVKHYTMYWVDN